VTQGNIEIVLTGHFSDFENTTLISKNTIDEVNAEIKVNDFEYIIYINYIILNNIYKT